LREWRAARKFLAGIAAIAMLSSPTICYGQSADVEAEGGAVVGGAAGGTTGTVVDGLIFGPIGAIIGGFTGATIGAAASVEDSSVEYLRLNPTEPVVIKGDVRVGFAVPAEIELHLIEGDAIYGY